MRRPLIQTSDKGQGNDRTMDDGRTQLVVSHKHLTIMIANIKDQGDND